MHVQRDVVIDDKDGARPVIVGIPNVRNHAIGVVGVKIASPHLDDRTEAAIERAAPRRLDDIDRLAQQGIAFEYTSIPVGRS